MPFMKLSSILTITLILIAKTSVIGQTEGASKHQFSFYVNDQEKSAPNAEISVVVAGDTIKSKYNEGCKQAKSSIMKPAFSEQATMFSVGADGKLSGGAIQHLFDGVDKGFRPSPEAQSAIARIEIVGTAASARIDANDVSGFSFTDFFHLLKIDGKWTVISKIFHTHVAP